MMVGRTGYNMICCSAGLASPSSHPSSIPLIVHASVTSIKDHMQDCMLCFMLCAKCLVQSSAHPLPLAFAWVCCSWQFLPSARDCFGGRSAKRKVTFVVLALLDGGRVQNGWRARFQADTTVHERGLR